MAIGLQKAIGTTDTVITVTGGLQNISGSGVIQIDAEEIFFGHATESSFLDCVRGFNSTTAAAHLVNAPITNLTENTQSSPSEFTASGAPVNGITGVGLAATGSRYTDSVGGTVWVNTGTPSAPVWAELVAGASGANTALSNLVTPAVNASLVPGSNNAIDLGTDIKAWRKLFLSSGIQTNGTVLTVTNDAPANTPIDINFVNGGGGTSEVRMAGSGANGLYMFSQPPRTGGGFGVDDNGPSGTGRGAFSSTGFVSAPEVVMDNAGLHMGGTAGISLNGNKITSVADPTLAQDAATKNYVDTHSGSQVLPQVANVQSTTFESFTSSTYTPSSVLTLTKSLQKSTNKWKIKLASNDFFSSTPGSSQIIITIFRDGVDLDPSGGSGLMAWNQGFRVPGGTTVIDSPGDTSAHTYVVKVKNQNNTTAVWLSPSGGSSNLILEEILS